MTAPSADGTRNLPQDACGAATAVRHWLGALPHNYSPEDRKRLMWACDLLLHHGDRGPGTGETQVHHLLRTADILVRLRLDADTLIAALFKGCPEHLGVGEEQSTARFGPGIAGMMEDLGRIDQLANLDAVIATKDQYKHYENLRRLLLDIAKDVRVVLVVLAEQLHLMRSLDGLDAERRRELAQDTLRLYAPLANRLGVGRIKWELEDLAMRHLEPKVYQRIARQLDGRRVERESCIAGVIATLKKRFTAAGPNTSTASGARCSARTWTSTGSSTCRRLATHPRGVRRLHRYPQGQPLPVAAHGRGRTRGQTPRGADSHLGHAPACRARCSGPLGLQGE